MKKVLKVQHFATKLNCFFKYIFTYIKKFVAIFLLNATKLKKKLLPRRQKKNPVDFDDELKVGDVRYKHLTKTTIKVQLFWRLPYQM